MEAYQGIRPVFDDPNLVSDAGVIPVLALAESAGLSDLVARFSSLAVPSVTAKAKTIIAGMACGADSIDDLNRLRSGGMNQLFGFIRAPSTIGTFLRSFTNGGHIEQLGKINRFLLSNLKQITPTLIGSDDLVFVDIDDTIKEVHGRSKGGAGYGYTGVRGLNAMLATVSTANSAPVILEAQLRRGNTRSGSGAARQIARALTTTKNIIEPSQRAWVRADSAFCNAANVAAALKAGAYFSLTIPSWPTVTKAIADIPGDAWIPIQYPNAIADPDTGELISEAEVAEVLFTAFSSKPESEQVNFRLIVRRVARKSPHARNGQEQLFPDYRHHAFITNAPLDTVDTDKTHRQHALIEQTMSEVKGGPLAHLPSGKFHANAAWLALAVITFNLMRAAAHAASMPKARFATIKDKIIHLPARIASRARQRILHLPAHWPWEHGWERLWNTATNPT